EAGDGVAGSDGQLEAAGGLDEERVAGAVAERVVDQLEAVEVEEEDAEEAVLLASRVADAVAQAVDEERPVGEAGEGVVERVVDELLLGELALGGVGLGADHAVGAAAAVADGEAAAEDPAVAAVLVAHAVLALERRGAALEVVLEEGLDLREVLTPTFE